MLKTCYSEEHRYEIGVDEAGRGPLFGRLYVASVVLPKGSEFRHMDMKDSKKFHSKQKIKVVSDYIKDNAVSWSIQYIEADVIDAINIRQAVFRGMHNGIRDVILKMRSTLDIQTSSENITPSDVEGVFLMIDGNDFRPYSFYQEDTEEIHVIPHQTIEGGDNKYTAIAAASILAKVAHDEYIQDMCSTYPELIYRYGLDKNVGYGTKQHLEGILEHGITQWHRKTYGRCKDATYSPI
jgi:ribonuclease HII